MKKKVIFEKTSDLVILSSQVVLTTRHESILLVEDKDGKTVGSVAPTDNGKYVFATIEEHDTYNSLKDLFDRFKKDYTFIYITEE